MLFRYWILSFERLCLGYLIGKEAQHFKHNSLCDKGDIIQSTSTYAYQFRAILSGLYFPRLRDPYPCIYV